MSPSKPAGLGDLETGAAAYEVVLAAAESGKAPSPPEWLQLTPRGDVTARDGRKFSFDPERLAAAFVEGGLKLPIDFDHESEFTITLGAKPARSWIVDMEARPQGLFGKVEWLPDAVAALRAKAYRYISPTFYRDEDGITARLIKAAALVAAPALGMPALAQAETRSVPAEIATALGLPTNCEVADAVASIEALRARNAQPAAPSAAEEIARRLGIDPKVLNG